MIVANMKKKDRKDAVRQLIGRYPHNIEFSTEDVALLSDLTETHLFRAIRRINAEFPSDPRHIHVVFFGEDDWVPFSWNKAISPVKHESEVKKAMRGCIKRDMDEFRWSVEQECEECGATEDLCCDHVYPFNRIAMRFIEAHGLPELKEGRPGEGWILADESVVDDWVIFHTENAVYQLLCRSCNSSKGAK